MQKLWVGIVISLLCSQQILAQQPVVKRLYYPNGKLRAEMSYIGDTPSGYFREYTEQGQLRVEEYYVNGKIDSVRREYYDNGQLRSETYFKDGLRHGSMREFYENGKIQSDALYHRDTLVGVVKYYFYHPNGRLREEASVNAAGLLEGTKRTYHSNGALEMEEHYRNGMRSGELRRYLANGTLKVRQTYKDDQLDGEERIYSDDGKLEEINTFRNGVKVHTKRYDERGNLVEELDERALQRQRLRR
ncbi:MAG: toxin-antitoxin system YwqK family antitoxin [Chloroherpetonaceae bacterium]|nr:toxin-antitoxin system YwqK family antitoxin [Chloroherpetonaceae bacterium]